jgi:hypothetical protein
MAVAASDTPLMCLTLDVHPVPPFASCPALRRAFLRRFHMALEATSLQLICKTPSHLQNRLPGPAAAFPVYVSLSQWSRVMVADHLPAVLNHLQNVWRSLLQARTEVDVRDLFSTLRRLSLFTW